MMLCDSGWHRISILLCQTLHCVLSHPVEYLRICPLFTVPMLLHYYYLMSKMYMSRMSTSLDLPEILLKQEAGRRTSKEPSFCLLLTSKAHTGDSDFTSGSWLLPLVPIIPSGQQTQDPHASLVFFLAEPKANYFSK